MIKITDRDVVDAAVDMMSVLRVAGHATFKRLFAANADKHWENYNKLFGRDPALFFGHITPEERLKVLELSRWCFPSTFPRAVVVYAQKEHNEHCDVDPKTLTWARSANEGEQLKICIECRDRLRR